MKRILALSLAFALASAALCSTAFVVPKPQDQTKQVSICSTMVVDVKTAATGIRSYTELIDSTALYQAGDMLTVATTIEVKNRAKHTNLASIDGCDIDIVQSSQTADFSYAGVSPVVLSAVISSNMWGMTSNVATMASRIYSGCLSYDRSSDNLTLHMVGKEDHGTDNGVLQFYTPTEGKDKSGNMSLFIPALNAADYKTNYGTISAPEAVQYTLIVTALARQATEGSVEAKLLVRSAERFFNASDKLYAKFFGENAPTASLRVFNVGKKYAVVRFYDDAESKRTGFSASLEALGYPLGERADKLSYRGEKGTLELYQIYAYDDDYIDGVNLDKFILGLVTEHSEDPTARIKGIAMADRDSANEIVRTQTGKYIYSGVGKNDGGVYADNSTANAPSGMSAKDMDSALTYFGMDVGIGTGGGIVETTFESKGAGPQYTDAVRGTYKYGVLVIEDTVAEGTEEEPIEDEEPVEEEEIIEIPDDEEPVSETIPKTGDEAVPHALTASLLALAAAAAFAALKKARGR